MDHFWHEISKNWQAILTLVVSVAVAFISLLQWRTAKQQWQTSEKQSETAKQQWQTADKQAETAKNKLRLDLSLLRGCVVLANGDGAQGSAEDSHRSGGENLAALHMGPLFWI